MFHIRIVYNKYVFTSRSMSLNGPINKSLIILAVKNMQTRPQLPSRIILNRDWAKYTQEE